MSERRYLCEPCDHRWFWQHRNPDPQMRLAGAILMLVGAVEIIIGLGILVGRIR